MNKPLVDFDRGVSPFSGDSDHFWREHPPNNGTGLLILGQHCFAASLELHGKTHHVLHVTGVDLGYILHFTSDSKGSKQHNLHSITGPKSNHEMVFRLRHLRTKLGSRLLA